MIGHQFQSQQEFKYSFAYQKVLTILIYQSSFHQLKSVNDSQIYLIKLCQANIHLPNPYLTS